MNWELITSQINQFLYFFKIFYFIIFNVNFQKFIELPQCVRQEEQNTLTKLNITKTNQK